MKNDSDEKVNVTKHKQCQKRNFRESTEPLFYC